MLFVKCCSCWLFMVVVLDIKEDEDASVVTTGIPGGGCRSDSVGVGGPAVTTIGA